MKIKFCACGWRINIWNFILDSSVSVIWYLCSVSAIVLVFRLLFSFCNLVSASTIWYLCSVSAIVLVFHLLFSFCNLVSASAIWYFCYVSAIVLVFPLLFSFCNLAFELSFCKKIRSDILSSASAKSGISTVLQLLQNLVFRLSFSFCNLIFQSVSAIVLVFHLLFSFCNLVSASAIWYFYSVSAIILVFRLLFSFCNLVFELSFCKKIWSDILSSASTKSGISTVL
jgi:hypothetical protein